LSICRNGKIGRASWRGRGEDRVEITESAVEVKKKKEKEKK
jgi:hypothetical protein